MRPCAIDCEYIQRADFLGQQVNELILVNNQLGQALADAQAEIQRLRKLDSIITRHPLAVVDGNELAGWAR